MLHFFQKNAKGLPLLTLLGALALPATAQVQGWAPYFGNTHFGFSTEPAATFGNSSPAAAKLADLDGDGDLDAVVAQGTSGTGFVVLRNLWEGYFATPTPYTSPGASQDVEVADITGDSIPDVVVANTGQYGQGTSVSLFPGLGNGQFGTPVTIPTGTGPSGLAVADFNADGHLDIATANYGYLGQDSTVSILLNSGSGLPLAPISLIVGKGVYKLAVAELTGDSLPDLVAVADDQYVHVLHNLGNGAFQKTTYHRPGTVWAGDNLPTVALADMDGDQDLDVVTSSSRTWNGSRGVAVIWSNNGAGVLAATQTEIEFENFSGGTGSLVVADLNHDNLPDLVSASTSGRVGDGYRVVLNQGSGTFGPAKVRPAGQYTSTVLVGNIDNDGHPDVLTLDGYSRELTVHHGLGSGQFPDQTLVTSGVSWLAGSLESGDIDNDGDLDLITSSNTRAGVAVGVGVLRNNGNGTFASGVQITNAGVQAKLRDLNGDGFLDLLYVGGTGSTGYNFYTALNSGTGTFATPVLWNVGACAPEDIDAADMDGDGDLDVVATNGCNAGVSVSYNSGTATFGPATTVSTSSWSGPLALGDFNEDGHLDVAAGVAADIAILLGSSTGLGAPTDVAMDQAPFDILAADVNDDGHLDLASCNYGSGPGDYSMALRLGNGDGTFQPVVLLPAAYSPDLANVSGIACGDIDNDNDLDLMVSNNATNDMSVYLNQGGGQFSAALRSGLYYGARSPLFADFNGDGHCEVAALVDMPPSGFQSALVILQGTNSGLRTAGTGLVVLGTPAEAASPATLRLSAAPNPFGQATTLSFTLPRATTTTLAVYNVLGQEVARPFSGPLTAGLHAVSFSKGHLPAGTYHVRLTSATTTRSATVVVE